MCKWKWPLASKADHPILQRALTNLFTIGYYHAHECYKIHRIHLTIMKNFKSTHNLISNKFSWDKLIPFVCKPKTWFLGRYSCMFWRLWLHWIVFDWNLNYFCCHLYQTHMLQQHLVQCTCINGIPSNRSSKILIEMDRNVR